MEPLIDLHTHTTCSDGTRSPREQVEYARRLGLYGIGITDHDTVAGWEEAMEAGKELNVLVVPGVEISSVWNGKDIHVLGYYLDPSDSHFQKRLVELRNVRNRRNEMMVERLNQLGIAITIEEINAVKQKNGGNVGRPHIAEVLMKKGVVASIEEAFDKYLGRNGLAYVNPPRITPFEAVELILSAGGVPVLAHPGLYEEDQLIEELVGRGMAGIEAYHADHPPEEEQKYEQLGRRFNLIITGGSDYHGERNGKVFHAPLGSKGVPLSTVLELKKRALKRS
jgi:predicted metal-dependent phosphoesterase TrpH